MKSNEQLQAPGEHQLDPHELAELGREHREQLRERYEKGVETGKENSVEAARAEALEKAAPVEQAPEKTAERSPAERRRGPISRKERDASYKATMKEVQSHMSPAQRVFSKFIHHKTVDQISETVGNTVARPNAILSGAVAAFLFSLLTLLIAKHYGYRLSGFEAIGAFIAGWLLGVLYDFFKVMITGKK